MTHIKSDSHEGLPERSQRLNTVVIPEGFRACMKAVEDKLVENRKLQEDGKSGILCYGYKFVPA